MLALVVYFEHRDPGTSYTQNDIQEGLELSLPVEELMDRAVRICSEAGLIEQHEDDFGPKSYSAAEGASGAAERLRARFPVFENYQRQRNRDAWLSEAVSTISSNWRTVAWSLPDAPNEPDVWEPIPIDREDPAVKEAVSTVEAATEAIRADNGYAATHDEERRYVLDHLSSALKRLKEDTQIGWMYLKEFALDPLTMVIRRFGKAATGLAATEAQNALLRWLRERIGDILDSLLN